MKFSRGLAPGIPVAAERDHDIGYRSGAFREAEPRCDGGNRRHGRPGTLFGIIDVEMDFHVFSGNGQPPLRPSYFTSILNAPSGSPASL